MELVILVSSLRKLTNLGIAAFFTNKHAVLRNAKFYQSLDSLGELDWALWQEVDFKRDDNDLAKLDRYQAEALVHQHLPVEHLQCIVCRDASSKQRLEAMATKAAISIPILDRPEFYFHG